MKRILLLIVLSLMMFACSSPKTNLDMPSIFSDNMVLQRNSEVAVWGTSYPNESIVVEAAWGEKVESESDENGNWEVMLKTTDAGGPYELKIISRDTTITFSNVLLGEVWVCSGQSNMEMPLAGWPPRDLIGGSDEAIQNASNDNIRLFTVLKSMSFKPENDCSGSWHVSSPETASSFSATAYFFGKKLYNELQVPIGLIHTSWGGTPAEAWTSKEYLKQLPEFSAVMERIDSSAAEIDTLMKWTKAHMKVSVPDTMEEVRWMNLQFGDEDCFDPSYNDSSWQEMDLPRNWENSKLGVFDGVVWFRKTIELPDNWVNKNLELHLGSIDDMDVTYVNGVKIGGYDKPGFWQQERIYNILPETNNMKKLSIAVRVIDNQGGGGIYGIPEKLKINLKGSNQEINLAGSWKYLPIAEYIGSDFYVFDIKTQDFYSRPKVTVQLSPYSPTTLFNAMINPILNYGIKGAIWYQGESNTGNPALYKKLFPLMITNWRDKWGRGDFPFYFVQIAPYNYGDNTQSEKLREAQMQTLSLQNTGMAVTLDIGNPENIHPGNKKDVGERLALLALAKDYGKDIVYSGPIYKSMEVSENSIILSFEYAESGLMLKPISGRLNFQIAGEDKIFSDASVKIDGDKLIVSNPKIKNPVAVRYAWSNIAEATLFNNAGLPASSFRTDDWE